MIEQDDGPLPDRADADMLLYDYFKWITTLSLLTLGGVLSLSQSADLQLTDREIALTLVPVCAAGATAWTGADGIVRRRSGVGKPRIASKHYVRLATLSLGLGVGAFLSIFWDVLK